MDKCVYMCVYGYEKLVFVKRTNQGNFNNKLLMEVASLFTTPNHYNYHEKLVVVMIKET